MIFQLDVEYGGKDKMIQDALIHFETPTKIKKDRPIMEVKTEDLDPLFLNIMKKYNLGTKISGVRVHGMKSGSESEDPHNHPKARAVYYLQAPEGVGSLTLPDRDIIIKPHTGLLVVVPAKERHGITRNMSNEIRLVLAFYIE